MGVDISQLKMLLLTFSFLSWHFVRILLFHVPTVILNALSTCRVILFKVHYFLYAQHLDFVSTWTFFVNIVILYSHANNALVIQILWEKWKRQRALVKRDRCKRDQMQVLLGEGSNSSVTGKSIFELHTLRNQPLLSTSLVHPFSVHKTKRLQLKTKQKEKAKQKHQNKLNKTKTKQKPTHKAQQKTKHNKNIKTKQNHKFIFITE